MFQSTFSVCDYLRVCDKAFRLYGSGVLKNPAKKQEVKKIDGIGIFRLEMPAIWPQRYRMLKVIEERSDGPKGRLGSRVAYIQLKDLRKNKKVVIDADHITNMRTGAGGALAIKYIANRAIKRVSIIGAGRIARSLALAIDTLFSPQQIMVTSRNAKNVNAFVQLIDSDVRARLIPASSVSECLDSTDAVLTAVPSANPILSLNSLPTHVPVCVIAGDPRSRQLAPNVLESKTIIVDNLEQAHESGEFIHAIKRKRFGKIQLLRNDAGTVVNIGIAASGRLPSNQTPDIVYLTGLAVQDLLASIMVYENWERISGRCHSMKDS